MTNIGTNNNKQQEDRKQQGRKVKLIQNKKVENKKVKTTNPMPWALVPPVVST